MKIGIYGGSFSPPHKGHVKLAQEFVSQMELDRLIVIPAGVPPHKKIDGGADSQMRLEMCKVAFLPLSDVITVSDYEIFRTDPCYTVDTLRHFSAEGELYMLCGSDMFLSLESWRSPEEIFRLATIVCGARVAAPTEKADLCVKAEEYIKKYGAKCEVMVFEPVEVSSTDVRDEIRRGIRPDALTDEVYELICKNGLYGYNGGIIIDKTRLDVDGLRERVRARMDERRYAHTLGVEAMAVRLGEMYLPHKTDELRCAALLHDITKQETLEKQLQYIVEFDIMIKDFGELTPALLHSMTGAAAIPKDFPEYATEDIVSAVRWHTTGRRDMTLFDSLIYLADYIEDGRDFDDCVSLRRYFWEEYSENMTEAERTSHLWRTMVRSVDLTVAHLTSSGRYIDVNTIECRNYYLEKINKKQTL